MPLSRPDGKSIQAFVSSRRQFLSGAIAGLPLATLGAFPAHADSAPILSNSAAILDLLDNAAWVPDGQPNERQIYILGAPWCPVCKSLYVNSRAYSDQVQLRWIEGRSLDSLSEEQNIALAFTRDPAVLDQVYRGSTLAGKTPDDGRWRAQWNNGVIESLRATVASRVPSWGVPTLIWVSRTKPNLYIIAGDPSEQMQAVITNVVPRAAAKDIQPKAAQISAKDFHDKTIVRTQLFAKSGRVFLHAIPDEASPLIYTLEAPEGYMASQVARTQDGRNWAFLDLKSLSRPRGAPGGWALLDELVLEGGGKGTF